MGQIARIRRRGARSVEAVEHRHQVHQREREEHAADDDDGQRPLRLASRSASRAPPAAGRRSPPAPSSSPAGPAGRSRRISASSSAMPCARRRLKAETNSSPFMTATPRIEMKPTAGRDVEVQPGELQGPDAAERHGQHVGEHHRRRRAASGTPGRAARRSAPATRANIRASRALGLLHLPGTRRSTRRGTAAWISGSIFALGLGHGARPGRGRGRSNLTAISRWPCSR